MSSTTLSEQRVFGMQLVSGLVGTFLFTVSTDAHITSRYPFDGSGLVIQNFACGKTREKHDAEFLGLFTHPAAKITQTGSVVSVVVQGAGDKP